ncbi:MAG TPA: ABC transporter permease subunit [Spirochaetales bacterium]|nr:ABC transporter permease subunit [Spirochaetales bacterium]HQK34971.1 ABC transporter permease subunit [Spirochaetales bacterium]HRV27987.1 ABC transporter permease subunit [Spirochaetia bacterium]
MHKASIVFRRELKSYFNVPIAWLFIVIFNLAISIFFFFVQQFFALDRADLRPYFSLLPLFFTILVPALTMKMWAEEKKQGTYEMLMTMPFSEFDLVIGKFLAAFVLLLIAIASTVFIPITMFLFGYFDPGQIFAQYIGIFLFAAACSAIGQYVSANTKSQISAFVVTMILLIILNIFSQIPLWFNMTGKIADVINWLSVNYHYNSFAKGVLDSRDALYFLIITTGFLYATMQKLYLGRWR